MALNPVVRREWQESDWSAAEVDARLDGVLPERVVFETGPRWVDGIEVVGMVVGATPSAFSARWSRYVLADPPEGHRSLGYESRGVYRCSCGERFGTDGCGPVEVIGVSPEAVEDSAAWGALRDRWTAHQRGVARRPGE